MVWEVQKVHPSLFSHRWNCLNILKCNCRADTDRGGNAINAKSFVEGSLGADTEAVEGLLKSFVGEWKRRRQERKCSSSLVFGRSCTVNPFIIEVAVWCNIQIPESSSFFDKDGRNVITKYCWAAETLWPTDHLLDTSRSVLISVKITATWFFSFTLVWEYRTDTEL